MNVYEPHKQDFKAKLLDRADLGEQIVNDFSDRIHMIKLSAGGARRHRLLMHDGGWLEIDAESREVVTWGRRGLADDLAIRLVETKGYNIQRLEKSASASDSSTPRHRPRPLDSDQTQTLADGWRRSGFDDVTEGEFGCWIALTDGSRLYDTGDHVEIHGPVSDAAITALVGKASADWDSGLRLTGTWTEDGREQVWLECQRRGVALADYQPSPELLARWETEQSQGQASATGLRPPRDFGAVAQPSPGHLASRATQVADIDRQLERLHSLWRTDGRDTERLEQARREVEKLEELKRQVLGLTRDREFGVVDEREYHGPR